MLFISRFQLFTIDWHWLTISVATLSVTINDLSATTATTTGFAVAPRAAVPPPRLQCSQIERRWSPVPTGPQRRQELSTTDAVLPLCTATYQIWILWSELTSDQMDPNGRYEFTEYILYANLKCYWNVTCYSMYIYICIYHAWNANDSYDYVMYRFDTCGCVPETIRWSARNTSVVDEKITSWKRTHQQTQWARLSLLWLEYTCTNHRLSRCCFRELAIICNSMHAALWFA